MISVFCIFWQQILLQPQKAQVIVKYSVLLHSFLRRSRSSTLLYTPPGTFDSFGKEDGSSRADNGNLTLSLLPLYNVRRSCNIVKEVQKLFGEFFDSLYQMQGKLHDNMTCNES